MKEYGKARTTKKLVKDKKKLLRAIKEDAVESYNYPHTPKDVKSCKTKKKSVQFFFFFKFERVCLRECESLYRNCTRFYDKLDFT